MASGAVTKALFRLDSGGRYGLGHFMRSKALADALLDLGIHCTFAVHRLHSAEAVNPHSLLVINNEQELIAAANAYDIIIIDHYDYTSEQFFLLSQINHATLVVLDDEDNRGNLYADIVVNPAAQATQLSYKELMPQALLLIGPEYILLKESFQHLQPTPYQQRESIVITFGGSDVTALTLPILAALKDSPLAQYPINVITGAGFEYRDTVDEYCHQYGYRHLHNVDNMAELFVNARLAISAAGTTAFELASCGTPTVFALVADNQLLSVTGLCQAGWCRIVDCREQNKVAELIAEAQTMLDSMPLETMSESARSQVDGQGAARVAECISRFKISPA